VPVQEGSVGAAEAAAGGDGEALANGALWVYNIAFEEFRRALATESRDRAELLAAMWDHCFALVQVRCRPRRGSVCAPRAPPMLRMHAAGMRPWSDRRSMHV
jgi:hypothetical protein